jgi:hypothetical protein
MNIKKPMAAFLMCCVLLTTARHAANGRSTGNTATDTTSLFELRILNSDYSLGLFVLTVLTNNKLTISISSGRVEERDSILFTEALQPSAALRELGEINLDGLKKSYSNDCMEDGLQMTISLKKDRKRKSVHVGNYYQEEIGKVILLVNSVIPGKYRIWYDKDKLTADYKRCKGIK